jgi:hypothetical protein
MKKSAITVSILAATAFHFASAAQAQQPIAAPSSYNGSYSDLADLALAAPLAAIVTVTAQVRLKGPDAAGVAPGFTRFYLEGAVSTLIAGRDGLPATVSWLQDIETGSANRMPKLRKARMILLARPTPGKPGVLQLVSRDAAIAWSPQTEDRLRKILAEANAASPPPVVTGVGHAFHVAGSIPGEGETQIFLRTANNRPVSLSILRRPGEEPHWSLALGEIVDDAAAAPQRDTLLWYRLACALPPALPDDSVSDQTPDDAAQARADYKVVLDALGPCGRSGTTQP